MDKTISISLGGFSFIVDDRAYAKLKNYLDEIRNSLHGMEGTDDIISDVETRIAELFKEKLGIREVVNEHDVDYIVDVMGRPEQYVEHDEAESNTTSDYSSSSYQSTYTGEKLKKKLYRDPNDKIIGGVLSGLAHYFGVEPWVTRLIWIVLFFSDAFISFTTITVVGYIILWIILPKAETATQRFEMYGQAGDFETIKKNASQAASEMKGVARDASSALGSIFQVLGKIILYFFGFMLICTGIGLIIAAIALLVTASTEIPQEFFGYLVDYPWQDILAKVLVFVLFTIPGILCVILGARIFSSRVKINKTFLFSSIGLWIAALICGIVLSLSLAKNFTREIEFADKKNFTMEKDTLTLNFNGFQHEGKYRLKWYDRNDMGGLVEIDGNLHRRIDDDIQIQYTDNKEISVEVNYFSRGRSLDDARENAEQIRYNYAMGASGELNFNNYFSLPKGSKFRDQDISIIVHVPKNKIIHTKNIDDVIFYDELNDEKDYEDGNNKLYKFVDNEFKCLNCPDEDWEEQDSNHLNIDIDSDSAKVKINGKGIELKDKDSEVIIKRNKIKISDGTDSLDIDISDN